MFILTFDIEEWFHILDHASTRAEEEWARYPRRLERNLARILDLLDERDQRATFFCLGWVARHFPKAVREIVARGHELATHSDRHQLAYEQTPAEFRADLKRSIAALQDAGGTRIRAYRAPGFSLMKRNSWVFDILIEEGIEVDCSIFPASRAHGGFPEFGAETPTLVRTAAGAIREFPINTTRVFGRRVIFSGGGYFRLFPGPLLRRFAARADYLMTYFHPRDFDPEQPMIRDLPLYRRFKSYYGLSRALSKLEDWLDRYSFLTLEEAEARVDWNKVPIVDLTVNAKRQAA